MDPSTYRLVAGQEPELGGHGAHPAQLRGLPELPRVAGVVLRGHHAARGGGHPGGTGTIYSDFLRSISLDNYRCVLGLKGLSQLLI